MNQDTGFLGTVRNKIEKIREGIKDVYSESGFVKVDKTPKIINDFEELKKCDLPQLFELKGQFYTVTGRTLVDAEKGFYYFDVEFFVERGTKKSVNVVGVVVNGNTPVHFSDAILVKGTLVEKIDDYGHSSPVVLISMVPADLVFNWNENKLVIPRSGLVANASRKFVPVRKFFSGVPLYTSAEYSPEGIPEAAAGRIYVVSKAVYECAVLLEDHEHIYTFSYDRVKMQNLKEHERKTGTIFAKALVSQR